MLEKYIYLHYLKIIEMVKQNKVFATSMEQYEFDKFLYSVKCPLCKEITNLVTPRLFDRYYVGGQEAKKLTACKHFANYSFDNAAFHEKRTSIERVPDYYRPHDRNMYSEEEVTRTHEEKAQWIIQDIEGKNIEDIIKHQNRKGILRIIFQTANFLKGKSAKPIRLLESSDGRMTAIPTRFSLDDLELGIVKLLYQ